MNRVALLINGGFLRPALQRKLGKPPTHKKVLAYIEELMGREPLSGASLFRTYYYDARPLRGSTHHPVDGSKVRLGGSPVAQQTQRFLEGIEAAPGITLRLGSLQHTGWQLGKAALRARKEQPSPVVARDLVPSVQQVGVEAAMAQDISVLALKRTVDGLVLVSGDPAIAPALRLARDEGLQVFLDPLGRPPTKDLRGCVDQVLPRS
jgi:uncharacterized LabA/DUF88 family protein